MTIANASRLGRVVSFAASDPANPNKSEEHPAIDVNGTRFDTPVQWTVLAQYTDESLATDDWNADKVAGINQPILPPLQLSITQGGGGTHVHREHVIPRFGVSVPLVSSSFRVSVGKLRATLTAQSVRVIAVPCLPYPSTQHTGPTAKIPAFSSQFARRPSALIESLAQSDAFGNVLVVTRFSKSYLHPFADSVSLQTGADIPISFEVLA